jgi:hypothetical protein
LTFERVHAFNPRQGRRGERTDCGEQEAAAELAAVLQCDGPAAGGLGPDGGGDLTAELDVAAQVEFVSDMVEITQRFRLAGEMLRPIPFVQQLL